tara:strand:+ start:101 stop:640 length:540 start_codon:yes stop_codon:yes gene_type:complete
MINNDKVRNVQVPFSPISGLSMNGTLGKIRLNNIYTQWRGESVKDIKLKHKSNPYQVRIGTPNTDQQLKQDRIYFISDYLSYNPISQDIEKRDIIARRLMEKVYIGQTTQEAEYKDYSLFVNGNVVAEDLILKKEGDIQGVPLTKLLNRLIAKVDQQSKEIQQLKAQLKNEPIYSKHVN